MSEIPYIQINEGKKLSLAALAMALATPLQGSGIDPQELYKQIEQHEGYRDTVYVIYGKPHIGIGFNLEEPHNKQFLKSINIDINDVLRGKKLTDNQIKMMYNFSLKHAYKDVVKLLPNFKQQPKEVKKILIDMSFNMGYNGLRNFKGMIKAIENGDYQKAALEMKYTNGRDGQITPWYKDTKTRAHTLVNRMANIR